MLSPPPPLFSDLFYLEPPSILALILLYAPPLVFQPPLLVSPGNYCTVPKEIQILGAFHSGIFGRNSTKAPTV